MQIKNSNTSNKYSGCEIILISPQKRYKWDINWMSVCFTELWFCSGWRSWREILLSHARRSGSSCQWITSDCVPALWTPTHVMDGPAEQRTAEDLGSALRVRCTLGVSCWCPVIIDPQTDKRLIGFGYKKKGILDWRKVKVTDEKQQTGSVGAHLPPPACFPSLPAPVVDWTSSS